MIKLYTAGFQNWTLSVWGGIKGQHIECNKIVFRGKYLSRELYSVFAEIDLLIVPSIWNETFSLITLEAFSFGVPVMVSNTVGAKDIVREYDDFFIFKTESELKEKLEIILKDASSLSNYNKKIVNNSWKYSMEIHTEQIRNLYRDILFPQQSINNP